MPLLQQLNGRPLLWKGPNLTQEVRFAIVRTRSRPSVPGHLLDVLDKVDF